MAGPDPGSARAEAERLVATALAMAQLAARGQRHGAAGLGMLRDLFGGATGPLATGEPACCVCPICRAVSALRDPSPELAERLATGAGDFAAGVASLLRAFAPAPEQTGTDPGRAAPDARGAAPDPGRAAPDGSKAGTDTGPQPGPTASAGVDPQVRNTRGGAHDPPSGRTTSDDEVWRRATRTGDDSDSAGDRDVWSAATNAPVDVAGADTPPVERRGGGADVAARDPRADATGGDGSDPAAPEHGLPG